MANDIQGIDVSHHQGSVDWEAVSNDPGNMRFGIAKATEGADFLDPRFMENMSKIRELNEREGRIVLYPGAYHFARPDNRHGRSGGETEGRWFCETLLAALNAGCIASLKEGFLEPWLDFEKYSDSDYEQNIPWIEGFLHIVAEETGRMGGIYTGPNIWRYELGNTDHFNAWPLWEVKYKEYGEDPNASPPRMPTDESKDEWVWKMWQWSGGGDFDYYGGVQGVNADCDVNRFNGTEDDLAALAGSSSPPIDPPPIESLAWPRPPQQLDLNTLRGSYSDYVARVQGLLLSHKYGPDGLTGSNGLPDGLMGNKTESYLKDFKTKHRLSADTVVNWDTWWALVYDKLRV